MEIKDYDQAAEFVNSAIPSGRVKEFLFGFDDVMSDDIKGVGAINKMLILQFVLVYLKWLGSSRRELYQYTSREYTYATEVLYALYKGQKFSLNAAIFVLFEAYKDVVALGEASFFASLIDTSQPCEFGKILARVEEYNRSLASPDKKEILRHFVSLVNLSKAVRSADISYVTRGNDVETLVSLNGKALKSYDILYTDKTNVHYVLLDKAYEHEDVLCHYMAIDDCSTLTIIKKANRR